ncbi:MAG: glycosyltransferase family 4 protein [Anaerolineaceae bacterium]|nr:glycosyltransferase family 4 protein [Anaerolineaceae bacterium]
MKVILVANTDWYLYNFRLALARALQDAGYDVVLVSPPGAYADGLREAGFRWIPWNVGRRGAMPWDEIAAFCRLWGIYRAEHPTIVHHFTIKPVLYGSLAARLAGVFGVVNSITGRGYLFLQNTWKTLLLRFGAKLLYRLVLRRSRTVVTFENPDDRAFFSQEGLIRGGSGRVIEGAGLDPLAFFPASEPEGIPVVVLPARMLWDKGVGVLVEAARILKKHCEVRVALVGNLDPGNPAAIDEATILEWVTEGVIEWWGFREDMARVYQSCHIVTLPSLGEGLPTALIEASACGRPIVTTDAPGCRNVVIDGVTGFLVPIEDPQALSNALFRLLGDPELRQQMGREGRHFALTRFTDEQVNRSFLEVYRAFAL